MNNRKKIILELQKKAEDVRSLKQEHRQKRPIIIEFSGSPKAGKTSCINSLELFLKRNGFTVKIIQERASVCPVTDKQSPMFNLWTVCMSLAGLIGTIENKHNSVDVLILDRGIFDALCWFQWQVNNKKMEEEQRNITEKFLLMYEIVKCIDIVFAFSVTPEVSIEREYATLLTDKLGTIMNEKVLGEYLDAMEITYNKKKKYFHEVFKIETTKKNQDEVGKEVTEITLDTLKNLLMERIGYFEKNTQIEKELEKNQILDFKKLEAISPSIKYDLRENVESNDKYIQPIPIAVITTKDRKKILAIKKNKKSVSSFSPEKDKLLLYIGGHSRYEDSTEVMSTDLLSIFKCTLRREVKEEIGVAIAIDNIKPFIIYTPNNEKSKKHMAVCFLIEVDEDGIKLQLDSNELILNKGKSKSGKFLSLDEICQEKELEEWSINILKHSFNIDYEEYIKQLSFFE